MSRPGHRDRERNKYEPPNPRRTHSIMSPEDVQNGKKSYWPELEITGSSITCDYLLIILISILSNVRFDPKPESAVVVNDSLDVSLSERQ